MERKANIIKSLKMMGYSVMEDNDIFSIALQTGNGYRFVVDYTGYELETKDYVVEEIVEQINQLIMNFER